MIYMIVGPRFRPLFNMSILDILDDFIAGEYSRLRKLYAFRGATQ